MTYKKSRNYREKYYSMAYDIQQGTALLS